MPGLQAGFFPELAIHGVHRVLVDGDTALRKLPGILPDTACPHHSPGTIAQYYSDICTVAIRVNHFAGNLKSYRIWAAHSDIDIQNAAS